MTIDQGPGRICVGDIVRGAGFAERLNECDAAEAAIMRAGVATLEKRMSEGDPVYGVTRGFGPLVAHAAAESSLDQGAGLISHLGSGQGEPLSPEASRLLFWLRLNSIRRGHSAVAPEFWGDLAERWNRGFTPVVPRDGTVSASGDLQPLAHAALALAGEGQAWLHASDGWTRVPASDALAAIDSPPVEWPAREALAFVNGTSASLAVTLLNHLEVQRLVRATALLTARSVTLLGASPEAYHSGFGHVRGQPGQLEVARWIREAIPETAERSGDRPLQEPYSLRCVPQILGAVLDQLTALEPILVREATGCTDNPVCYQDQLLHGGNFHAMPTGLSSDSLGLFLQQIAYLADRQLALLCSPETNGGLPLMLSPSPGSASGLAGVQLSATSFVSRIRQLVYPASLTALPTNGGNQDHVPMALNGANGVSDAIELGWLAVASLATGLVHYAWLTGKNDDVSGLWADLASATPPMERDRPLAAEVVAVRDVLAAGAARLTEHEWKL